MVKRDELDIKLLEYLDGTLPAAERAELERLLAEDEALRKMLDEMKSMLGAMGNGPEQMPSPALDARFLDFLEKEKAATAPVAQKTKRFPLFSGQKSGWELAAACILLLIGVGFGIFWRIQQRHQTEIAALHEEMKQTQRMLVLAMLEKPSASERIRAVNTLGREQSDPKITDALIHTLNFDDMTNVRMKAAKALYNFGDAPTVRDALINSLQIQESPEVQLILIEVLTNLGEKKATPTLKNMARDKKLLEIVRQKAAMGLETFL
jgi:HEAT repeats